ncbi:hypothetical protein [Formosa sp. S-31]|uniref:hypothetical protein n=1 Tax=Formosa sp. S-31 TaxID=2790949 RepID=UPI003EB7ABBF
MSNTTCFIGSTFIGLALIQHQAIVIGLAITVFVFLILLVLGLINTYKLKAENDKLAQINPLESEEEDKSYKDFTEGHLY